MTEIQASEHSVAEKVDEYFTRFLHPRLCGLSADSDKELFLEKQLGKFEMVEDRLAEWATRNDGSENPYYPPLEPKVVSSIITELNRQWRIVVSLQTIDRELRARCGLI